MSREQNQRGAIAWMARNPVAANLIMAMALIGGVLSSTRMRKEVFPEIDLDLITVSVAYPGASPAEVEQGIVLAVEEAVRSLDGVDRVRSSASEGLAMITIELGVGSGRQKALADVGNAVDRITSFPEEAEEPQVSLPEITAEAIRVVLYGDQDTDVLHALAEHVRDRLLALDDVTRVGLEGIPPLEISIDVPADRARAYGLTLDAIAAQVRRTAVEVPGGGVKTDAGEILLRTAERRHTGGEFADIPIVTATSGTPVRLGEIATIRDGYAENDEAAYFNGLPAVAVNVFAVGDQSPTDVGNAVKRLLVQLEPELPPGVGMATWNDRAAIYTERVNLLLRNAGIGLVLVLLILGSFLEPKLAFWVSLGIPISILGSLLFLPALGVSLNMISMFAFIVTLGIVVDDAIVVGENVFRARREGRPFVDAAIHGARQVATPVFFAVATTVAAFSPLLFLPGSHGKIAVSIPVIVILVLAVSLVESFFVLPAHLGHQRATSRTGPWSRVLAVQARIAGAVENLVEHGYRPLVAAALRRRGTVVAASVAVFLGAVGLVAGGRVKMIDFPKEETDWVTVQAELPYGVSVHTTEEAMHRLIDAADRALRQREAEHATRGVYSRVGAAESDMPLQDGGASGGHITQVTVMLVPSDERDVSAFELVDAWRAELGSIPHIESLSFSSSMRGSTKPIDLELSHRDPARLEAAAGELAERLAGYAGVHDIDDGVDRGKPQWDFTLSAEGTNAGLTPADVASQVRAGFYGAEALRQQRGRHEVKVVVRLPRNERESLGRVEDMVIRTPGGGEMPLLRAADVAQGFAFRTIERTDGNRVVRVQADVEETVANPAEIMAAIDRDVLPELRARYSGLTSQAAGRGREMQEFFSTLLLGLGLALIAIFALLAIPLKSYLQPIFVVMAVIPFGFVGAVAGHLAMGMDLSFFSLMGIVALSGVVVNDTIVLVHTTNRLRREGAGPIDAAVEAASRRFRPIALTTLTTFGGLAPLIFETSMQARMLVPMAVSLGFGIVISTVFVLLLAPCLFVSVERLRERRTTRVGAEVAAGGTP